MAKKTNNEDDFYDDIAKQTGGELLSNIAPVKYYVDTGNLAMNYVCSGKFIDGGVPGGKIIEMYGSSSSGKSLWGTNILRGTQAINGIAVYLDCENALNREFAAIASHLNTSKIVRYNPRSLEAVFLKIYNVIRKVREKYGNSKPLVFVYDSITVSPPERELKEVDLPEEYTAAEFKKIVGGKEQPGERAKICSKEFRKLETLLEETNTTLLVLNQIRSKIGVMYGNNKTTGGGGNALEFYAGLRVETSVAKKITNKLGAIIGVNLKVKNVKNRSSAPFKATEGIQLFFEKGINPVSGLLSLLVQSGRVAPTEGKSMYVVNEPYSQGQTVTFKANKELNAVPVNALLECPYLIDASDKDEVKNYLSIFNSAIEQSMDEGNVETAITDEEDLE